jgi:5-methylcytosine-specific restriction enzyme A
MRYCSVPRCPETVRSGRCPTHAKARQQMYDRYKQGDTRYDTTRWRRLRASVLAENPLCTVCEQQGQITVATVVDHRQPHRGDVRLMYDLDFLEGKSSESNLAPMCASCHGRKTAGETWAR